MKHYCGILTTITFVLIAGVIGCSDTQNPVTVEAGDEESTVQLTLTDTYDNVRNGAHLIMSYDAPTNSFKGTVRNTTNTILPKVRVEIHLSNGIELGPTPSIDLAPDETRSIVLQAMGPPFDMWTAHPEVGPSSGGNGEGSEGGSEHGQGGESTEGGGN